MRTGKVAGIDRQLRGDPNGLVSAAGRDTALLDRERCSARVVGALCRRQARHLPQSGARINWRQAWEDRRAQVILRWLLQRGVVAISKSVRKERIVENFDVFDFTLTPDDMTQIATLDTKTSRFFDHGDPKMAKLLGGVRFKT